MRNASEVRACRLGRLSGFCVPPADPKLRRCAISADALSYAETWQEETSELAAARRRGQELGTPSPSSISAATLAVLAAAVGAKAVVEVGTGVGVSGLRLLEGMKPDGILTTIDADANHQNAARAAFREAGIDASRARQITGSPDEVLPRLADAAYDLVVVNDPGPDPQPYLDQALRLLRDGGVVVVGSALGKGNPVADVTKRDSKTLALRAAAKSIKDNDELLSVLLPFSDGILIAAKRPS